MLQDAAETPSFVVRLLDPDNALKTFSWVLTLIYVVIPLGLYLLLYPEPAVLKLGLISGLAVVSMWVGSRVSVFDSRFRAGAPKFRLNAGVFHAAVWTLFLLFVVVTFATAPAIPIVSALQGADANTISQERGEFLKGRVGAEIALLYISTILVTTVIPYSIVLLYASRSKFRHLFALIFFVYCISFMAKSQFLNLILPLLAYFSHVKKLSKRAVVLGVWGSIIVLFTGTMLSLGATESAAGDNVRSNADYVSALYSPSGPLDYFVWRAFAVPIYTAVDTLFVHSQQFGDQPLMGATSSLLSAIFGLERINLERFVFEHQFGGWNETANANAVYVVDAYANFGYIGVALFGLFIGQMFRWFRSSTDPAFKSLWTIFAFTLFNASLIGMLFSNGFLYIMFHAIFISIPTPRKRR